MTTTEDKASITAMAALLGAQREFPPMKRDAVNPHFRSKYLTLDEIVSCLWPVLHKHGLVPHWRTEQEGERLSVTFILHHVESGDALQNSLVVAESGVNAQRMGSNLTYLRRYTAVPLLGIAPDEDDDGNEGAKPEPGAPAASSGAQRRRAPDQVGDSPTSTPAATPGEGEVPFEDGCPSLASWKKKLLAKEDCAAILAFAKGVVDYDKLAGRPDLKKEVLLATIEEVHHRKESGRVTSQEYELVRQFCNPQVEALQPKDEAAE